MPKKVLIVGPLTTVGEEVLELLYQAKAPARAIGLCDGDPRTSGRVTVRYGGDDVPIMPFSKVNFADWTYVVFCAVPHMTAKHARDAREAGCVVIDTTDVLTKPGYDRKEVWFVDDFNPYSLRGHPGILVVPSFAHAAHAGTAAAEVLLHLQDMNHQAAQAH